MRLNSFVFQVSHRQGIGRKSRTDATGLLMAADSSNREVLAWMSTQDAAGVI